MISTVIIKIYHSFLYFLTLDEKMDKIATRILAGLERIQSQAFEGKDLVFLNMNAKDITDIPIPTVPSLIYFKNGDPEIYPGTK